jgi:hypothetical protein
VLKSSPSGVSEVEQEVLDFRQVLDCIVERTCEHVLEHRSKVWVRLTTIAETTGREAPPERGGGRIGEPDI